MNGAQVRGVVKTFIKLFFGRGVVKSYAQNGEDVLLRSVFGKKKQGTYVEIGAFHPIQYSNTYSFYKNGWRGLVIDASDASRPLFRIFRPRDRFVQAAVSEKEEILTYHRFKDSAYNTLSDVQAREWQDRGVSLVSTEPMRCLRLGTILKEHGVKKIDLLSVDAEGLDLSVLKSHDWNVEAEVIVVESHGFDFTSPSKDSLYSYLTTRGYVLVAYAGFSLVFKKST